MKPIAIFKLVTAIVEACQDAKDEYLEARAPDSDGGKRITKEEWAEIADAVWTKKVQRLVVDLIKNL